MYGRDGHVITLTSQAVPDVVLRYSSWEQITDDIDDARAFMAEFTSGSTRRRARLGRQVGTYVLKNMLRSVLGR